MADRVVMQQLMRYVGGMSTPSPPDQTITRRPGGRSARVRDAVYAATLKELAEHGYGGLTAARIAERAGVHRTTLHRRWPDLDHLLAEALMDEVSTGVPIPDTGTIRGDLRQLLKAIAPFIDNPSARENIRALIAGAVRSTDARDVVGQVWKARFALGAAVIARAVERGELRADIPPETLLDVFVGPLYVRLLLTGDPIDNEFVDHVIDVGLHGTAAP